MKKINCVKLFIIIGIITIIAVIIYFTLTIEWVKPPVMTISMEQQKVQPGSVINNKLIAINKRLKQSPKNTRMQLQKADIMHKKGNTEQMIASAEKVLRSDENSAKAYYLLAEGYIKQEKYDEAEKNYRKSIAIDDAYAPAHLGMANIYLTDKKLNEAEKEYQKVIKLNDKNALAFHNLGAINAYNKKMQKAIEYFNKAAKTDPNMKKAWLNLGISYEKNGQKKKAIECYTKYLKFDPGNRQVEAWIMELQREGN